MNLKLNRPLCFFDIEATGIDIKKDRIVEISILKVYPTAKEESKTWLINPILPISKESIAISYNEENNTYTIFYGVTSLSDIKTYTK